MIRICSLEFLNRDSFETDVMLADGRVLFKKGSSITPEDILRLYFKEIYVEKWPLDSPDELIEDEIDIVKESFDFREQTEPDPVQMSLEEDLIFDEEEAKQVAQYAKIAGEAINLNSKILDDLQKSAYHYKIGVIRFKKKDLSKADFSKRLAEESYNLLLQEMRFSEKIAEGARFYMRKYDTTTFKPSESDYSDVPFSHIIAIADSYKKLLDKNYSKEEALKKMLQIGGNKFNVFVLHKFINKMRKL